MWKIEKVRQQMDHFSNRIDDEEVFTISSWTIHIRAIDFLQIRGDDGR